MGLAATLSALWGLAAVSTAQAVASAFGSEARRVSGWSSGARLHSGPSGAGDASEREKEHHDFVDRYPVTRCDWMQAVEGTDGALPRLPAFLDRFDWIVNEKDIIRQRGDADPTTVFCNSSFDSLRNMLATMDKAHYAPADRKRRVLVIAGGETWLSENVARIPENPYFYPAWTLPQEDPQLAQRAAEAYGRQRSLPSNMDRLRKEHARLSHWFQAIFAESKDMDFQPIRTMPAGLSERRLQRGNSARAAFAIGNTFLEGKEAGVLFTLAANNELSHCGNGWGEAQLWRDELRNWTSSSVAERAGVVSLDVRPSQWWNYLAAYRFLLTPPSCEVQSPAIVEALLVLTVPIVRRGHYAALGDLVHYGFPIVLVDGLHQIERDMLQKRWLELSPRLERFRSKCLTTDAYWRLATGSWGNQDECWPSVQ